MAGGISHTSRPRRAGTGGGVGGGRFCRGSKSPPDQAETSRRPPKQRSSDVAAPATGAKWSTTRTCQNLKLSLLRCSTSSSFSLLPSPLPFSLPPRPRYLAHQDKTTPHLVGILPSLFVPSLTQIPSSSLPDTRRFELLLY